MKRNIKINDNLSIEIIKKRKRTITAIYVNGERKVLANIETDDFFWSKVVFDKNYIVVYSRGCMVNDIPLNIEAAYNIQEQRMLDLSNQKLKVLLEYMLISRKGFELANILSFINEADLGLLDEDEKDDLKRYLTAGNSHISDEEVIKYILDMYPIFELYRNLTSPLTVKQYRSIEDEIGRNLFGLHIMPQSLTFVEQLDLESTNENKKDNNQLPMTERVKQPKQLQKTFTPTNKH